MFLTISTETKVFILEKRYFCLVGSWFPLDPSSSSPICVTLGDDMCFQVHFTYDPMIPLGAKL